MSKTNYLKILTGLKVFMIILCIIAIVGLFMPYEKSIGKYRENLLDYPEMMNIEEVELTNKDAVNLSILENFKVYNYTMNNAKNFEYNSDYLYGESLINVVITIVLIVSIGLILLFTILNKNVPIIIFGVILAISSLVMNFDITSRGALPTDNYTYGISYYLYIIIAILIIIGVIAKIVIKKKEKTLVDDTTDNKISEEKKNKIKTNNNKNNNLVVYLKKYWYIAVIIILVLIVCILLLSNKSSSNETDNNNANSNIDATTNNKNDTNNTNNNSNTGKTATSDNVEYTLFKINSSDYDFVLIGKNKNEGINDIKVTVEFYNKSNKYIGESYANLDAVSKDNEFAIGLDDAPESYDHYKVFIDLEETDSKNYVDKLKATSNENDENIVGQVKNTTDEEIEYMEVAIVFYKNNNVVGYDDALLGDIKPGRSGNFEFDKPDDKDYNDLEYDTYKIFINEAYSYTW